VEFVAIHVARAGGPTEYYVGEFRAGRCVRAVGPLGSCEGLGARAVGVLLRPLEESASSCGEEAAVVTAGRLQVLVDSGEATVAAVPEVVRVRVGVMGDALDEDVDALRFATAWVDRIAAAFGIDDVCMACTVNLRGSPAKDYSTSYWTADGVEHGRADGGDETWLAITRSCWEAALADVRAAETEQEGPTSGS
jgi:hypothetical protein